VWISASCKQVAILYDDDAPGYVLEGWERMSGERAAGIGYWDAVAALNTPTESYSRYAARRRDDFPGPQSHSCDGT